MSRDVCEHFNPVPCDKCKAKPVEPVANRAFLERILTAMEGVIDVADRKTDEFDALRSCVIDLTMMLHTAPPQRTAEPVQEPVAWSFELAMTRGEHGYADWSGRRVTQFKPNVPEGSIRNLTPLYAALLPRKPLTEEEIELINRDLPLLHMQARKGSVAVVFARAIERAHGIKE